MFIHDSNQDSQRMTEATDEKTSLSHKLETEQLSRRQALRKFGIGAGLTAFMAFGVDDFARMVGAALKQRASDNAVANDVANAFLEAGAAWAAGSPSYSACGASNPPGPCGGLSNCNCCVQTKMCALNTCSANYTVCLRTQSASACQTQLNGCNGAAATAFSGCCKQYACNC
jgi:hypothetical protein